MASNPIMRVMGAVKGDGTRVGRGCWLWCPGCEEAHRIQVVGTDGSMPEGPCWEWDGNELSPTFNPSLLCTGAKRCHSFIRSGQWQFLEDCDHALAGQTVAMVPLPDWLARI